MERLVSKLLIELRKLRCQGMSEPLEAFNYNVNGNVTKQLNFFGRGKDFLNRNAVMPCLFAYRNYRKSRSRYNYFSRNWTVFNCLGWPGSLSALLFNSYNPNSENEFQLLEAALHGRLDLVLKLLDRGVNVNTRHPLGWTALHVAAVNGHLEVVEALLRAGADPNLGDNYSSAAKVANDLNLDFNIVYSRREQEFSKRLNSQATYQGFTALHYAVLINDISIVKALVNAGADPTKEDSANHGPIAYSKREMRKYLNEEIPKYEEKKAKEEKLRFPLHARLKKHIVGQKGAIATVSSAIRRKENGWADDEHPLVFLFLGSSGVGKTELAKHLANYLHKDKPDAFIRLDMSEYQEKHEVAKLIGSPPGYLGYGDGGHLTKKLKKFPNAVVLFDEVDKAHPDALTVLLQLFDEGRITDGKGETLVCPDAIFVMTSNLASDEIAKHAMELREESDHFDSFIMSKKIDADEELSKTEDITISRKFKENVVQPILKKHFKRDEFLGRINEIVYFLPFSKAELLKLVTMELEFWAKKAREKHGIELTWDNDVAAVLADGYNIHYGARSIKHEIERRLIAQLAAGHEYGVVTPGSSVNVKVVWPKQDKLHESTPMLNFKIRQRGQKNFVDMDTFDTIVNDNSFL